jgi:hypothetical protein
MAGEGNEGENLESVKALWGSVIIIHPFHNTTLAIAMRALQRKARIRDAFRLHENAGKCPDIFIIRCARAGHGSYWNNTLRTSAASVIRKKIERIPA